MAEDITEIKDSFFQKAWWVRLGQLDSSGGFIESFSTNTLDFAAEIDASAESSSGSETPQISLIKIYNVGKDVITMVGGNYQLYIKVEAGYVFKDGKIQENLTQLPEIYLGFIHYSRTYSEGVDVITEFHCTPAFDKLATARINKQFNKGTFKKDVFTALASAAGLSLKMDYKNRDSDKLKTAKTIEGGVSQKLTEWCNQTNTVNYVEKGVLYILDEDTKVQGKFVHKIPLSLIKGTVSLSVDVAQVIKKGANRTPDAELTTFLYPAINLRDVIDVQVPDYTKPIDEKNPTAVPFVTQQFVVTSYTHSLESQGAGAWETRISGKGEQIKEGANA